MTILKRIVDGLVYLIPPALSLLIASPLLGLEITDSASMLVTLPLYLAVLAAPGYVYCWYSPSLSPTPAVVWWVRVSMALAAVASLGGIAGAYWMILFFPPSAISLALVLRLWWRFEFRGEKQFKP